MTTVEITAERLLEEEPGPGHDCEEETYFSSFLLVVLIKMSFQAVF